jgi:hypothetical protein
MAGNRKGVQIDVGHLIAMLSLFVYLVLLTHLGQKFDGQQAKWLNMQLTID